jgi:phosphinothricin acetyltransferase
MTTDEGERGGPPASGQGGDRRQGVIRPATEANLAGIVATYNASIPGRLATADTVPVTVEERRSWFHDRDVTRHPIWVFDRGGPPTGWLSFGKFYGRPAYAATAEISIYVDPEGQRAGVATRLMQHALAHAPALGLSTLLGFVFAHNHPSLALCGRFAFETWGHLPRVAVLDGAERDLLILGRRIDGEGRV